MASIPATNIMFEFAYIIYESQDDGAWKEVTQIYDESYFSPVAMQYYTDI